MGWTRYWPAARALLVTLLIAISLVDGCPLPSTRHTPESLKPTVKALRNARSDVIRLVRPVREGFRLHQQWRLFPTANLKQHWLVIEGRTGRKAEWETFYRPQDLAHDFKADAIEYRRLRGAWNPGRQARRGYGGFTRWVSDEIFAVRPDITEVRVRLENIRVVPREGRFQSLGKFQFEKTRRRSTLQPEIQVLDPEQPGEEQEP